MGKEIKEETKDSKSSALAEIIEEFISKEDDFNGGIQSLTKAINGVLVKKYKCGVGNTDCSQFVLTFGDAMEIIPQSLNYKIVKQLIID